MLYKFLLNVILRLGLLAVIFGGALSGLIILFGAKFGIPPESIILAAVGLGFAAAMFGWALDSHQGYTARLFDRVYTREQDNAITNYENGRIDYQEALIKYFRASAQLAIGPRIFGSFFLKAEDKDTNERMKDKVWVVRRVLPLVANRIKAASPEFSDWVRIAGEMADCLTEIQNRQGFWGKFRSYFSDDQLAEEVKRLWERHQQDNQQSKQNNQAGATSNAQQGSNQPPLLNAASDELSLGDLSLTTDRNRQMHRQAVPLERQVGDNS